MTNEELDALEKRLRVWPARGPVIVRAADAIDALRRELAEARQHALDSQEVAQRAQEKRDAAIAALRCELDAAQSTFEDEQAAHQDTLRLLTEARGDAETFRNSMYSLEAQVLNITTELADFKALNAVNESGANIALDLLESMKALCEIYKAERDAAIARAEDEKAAATDAMHHATKAIRERDAAQAEARELREVLQEARHYVGSFSLAYRIDAALVGEGKTE